MVGFIKAWGAALICAAVVGTLCNMLLPKHTIAKVAKLLIGVYLAIVMVSPLLKAETALPGKIEFEVEQVYSESLYDEAVRAQTAENIRAQIEVLLAQEDIVCEQITVLINSNETGGIYCESVDITLVRQYEAKESQIQASVAAFCGTAPTLTYKDNA